MFSLLKDQFLAHYVILSGKCSSYCIPLVLMPVVYELEKYEDVIPEVHLQNVIIRVLLLSMINPEPTSIRSSLI